jgi:hypothetical protein
MTYRCNDSPGWNLVASSPQEIEATKEEWRRSSARSRSSSNGPAWVPSVRRVSSIICSTRTGESAKSLSCILVIKSWRAGCASASSFNSSARVHALRWISVKPVSDETALRRPLALSYQFPTSAPQHTNLQRRSISRFTSLLDRIAWMLRRVRHTISNRISEATYRTNGTIRKGD